MLRHQAKIMELYNFEKWNFEIDHVVIPKIQPLFEEMEDSIIFSVSPNSALLYISWQLKVLFKWTVG